MNETPKETIQKITGVLKKKEDKKIPYYYSIRAEIAGGVVQIADRETGLQNFIAEMKRLLAHDKPEMVIVEVFTGKSKKVREAQTTWQFYLNPSQSLQIQQGFALSGTPEVVKSETFTDNETHYREKLDLQEKRLNADFEKRLMEYEMKRKDEKIDELKKELDELDKYAEGLEKQLEKRPQFTGLGGINLLDMGSYMLEGFIKRNPQVLKTALRLSDQQLAGLFPENENQPAPAPQQIGQATVTVQAATENQTPEQQQRTKLQNDLNGFLSSLDNTMFVRVFNIMAAIQNNPALAEQLTDFINQKKQQ